MADPNNPPPYGTYGMLKGTVDRFVQSTVPTKLDRHVLSDLSGADYGALGTTLKFLGLMNDDRSVRQEFRDLVAAKKKSDAAYKGLLLDTILLKYEPIVGELNLQEGTLMELEKAFRDAGVPSGQMLTKAVRFFTKALEDADVEVSEHITKARPARSPSKGPRKNKKRKSENGGGAGGGDSEHSTKNKESKPEGVERLAMPGEQDAYIQYPSNLTAKHYKMFEAMLTVLKTYVSLDETEEGKKP